MMRNVLFALVFCAAVPAMAQPTPAEPTDDQLDAIVLIRVGDRVTGTGVATDDDAQSIVTSTNAIRGHETNALTVEYRGDGFRRAAIIVAGDAGNGIAVLWPAGGAPNHSAKTNVHPAQTGDAVLLLGHVTSPTNDETYAVGYGTMTVAETADTVLRRMGAPPRGYMAVEPAKPISGIARPTPGMAVFSATDNRLVGIVWDWNGDRQHPCFIVIPIKAIDAALMALQKTRR